MGRRVLRMLVTYSSTAYFVDQGRQGGISYEWGRLLEEELNRRFQKGHLHIDVSFIPVTRDRLLTTLVEGHGDIAAANLTVTAGRQQQVAFSEPIARGVKEIVVTGPGAPPVARVEDLSGQFVRRHRAGTLAGNIVLNRYLKSTDWIRNPARVEVDRHLFAFAAYNAGPARVAALRAQAAGMGLDPNRWRGNVEVAAAREIGRETVQYVANILKYYSAYTLVVHRSLEKSAVKKEIGA